MTNATKNSALLIGAFFATSVLNYGFGIALSWFFIPSQFGMLGIAQSILLLSALVVSSGFTWTAAQDLAAGGANEETRRRFRSAFIFNGSLGLLMAVVLWIVHQSGWFSIGEGLHSLILLIGLTTWLLSLRSVVNGAARGLYRFKQVSLNLVGEVVMKILIGLVFVIAGFGVTGVLIGFAAGAFLALLHSLWIVRKAELWSGRVWIDHQVIRTTVPLFAGMLGTALMLNLDILGLKFYAPPASADEMAGFYQAAVVLARTPVFIAQALTLVLFSYAARESLLPQGKAAKEQETLVTAFKSWTRLLLPGGLLFILAPQSALNVFYPDRYHQAKTSLQVAAVGGLLLALVTLLTALFQAKGQKRIPAATAALAVVVQIVTLSIFVPLWGEIGAAFSLVVAGSVSLAGLSILFFTKSGQIENFREHFSLISLMKLFLPLAAFCLSLILLPDPNRLFSFLKIVFSGLLYLTLLMAMNANKEQQDQKEAPSSTKKGTVQKLMVQFVQTLIGDAS